MTHVQTTHDPHFVKTRQQAVTKDGFEVMLEQTGQSSEVGDINNDCDDTTCTAGTTHPGTLLQVSPTWAWSRLLHMSNARAGCRVLRVGASRVDGLGVLRIIPLAGSQEGLGLISMSRGLRGLGTRRAVMCDLLLQCCDPGADTA